MNNRILFIDGSVGGKSGNTVAAAKKLVDGLTAKADLRWLHLSESPSLDEVETLLTEANAFVFLTGTYWDSWGSPLQRFLEDVTSFEGTDLWLGKPAAVLVTMHSVGGKEVMSRLQGVLSTMGLQIPPMSGMVYSYANQVALAAPGHEHQADLWSLDDLETVAANLMASLDHSASKPKWQRWIVDQGDAKRRWIS